MAFINLDHKAAANSWRRRYSWWKKSCASWYARYPVICTVSQNSSSTVSKALWFNETRWWNRFPPSDSKSLQLGISTLWVEVLSSSRGGWNEAPQLPGISSFAYVHLKHYKNRWVNKLNHWFSFLSAPFMVIIWVHHPTKGIYIYKSCYSNHM